jgi:3-phenylpropionate/cinnamic acid dioxygenase small subunit
MTSLEDKVNWLYDRAQVSELLFRFARALDTRDFEAYAALYAPGGTLELPDPRTGTHFVLRAEELAKAVPASLAAYGATHHISANHQIEVRGDVASSRSYLQAVHVRDDPRNHWSAGGWYDCDLTRTAEGWRFTRVKLTAVWLNGEPGPIKPPG